MASTAEDEVALDGTGHAGMSDAMQKILSRPLAVANPVLARAPRLPQVSEEDPLAKQRQEARKRRLKADSIHVEPDDMNFERETKLRKIANKGVVALFNAVRKQQKAAADASAEADAKSKFLEDLKAKTVTDRQNAAQGRGQAATWDVLRDSYMVGARMKDWGGAEEEAVEEVDGLGLDADDASDEESGGSAKRRRGHDDDDENEEEEEEDEMQEGEEEEDWENEVEEEEED